MHTNEVQEKAKPQAKAPNEKFRCILIFGPPGSGKGTMGRFLSEAAGLCHLSSGDIFRGLSPQSPGGRLFHQYASQGLLVPDEVTIEIWYQYVSGLIATNRYMPSHQFLLLDGIPRTLKQAQILDQYLDVEHIIFLNVPDQNKLIERLQRRAKIEGRKDDADVSVLKKRLDVYAKETQAVLSHYPKEIVSTFNGDQRPLEVLRDILNKTTDIFTIMPSAQKP